MRRLFDTELNSRSRAGEGVEEIWFDAEVLFEKSQERNLFGIAVVGRIKKTSADDTGTGRGKI